MPLNQFKKLVIPHAFGLFVFHRHTNESDCHRWRFPTYGFFPVLQACSLLICVQPLSLGADELADWGSRAPRFGLEAKGARLAVYFG